MLAGLTAGPDIRLASHRSIVGRIDQSQSEDDDGIAARDVHWPANFMWLDQAALRPLISQTESILSQASPLRLGERHVPVALKNKHPIVARLARIDPVIPNLRLRLLVSVVHCRLLYDSQENGHRVSWQVLARMSVL